MSPCTSLGRGDVARALQTDTPRFHPWHISLHLAGSKAGEDPFLMMWRGGTREGLTGLDSGVCTRQLPRFAGVCGGKEGGELISAQLHLCS